MLTIKNICGKINKNESIDETEEIKVEIIVGILGMILVILFLIIVGLVGDQRKDYDRLSNKIETLERKTKYLGKQHNELQQLTQAIKFLLEKDTEIAQYAEFIQAGVVLEGQKPSLKFQHDLENLIHNAKSHTKVREAVQCKQKCKQGKKK